VYSTVDSGLTITSSLQSHGKALEKECCLPGVFCDSGDTPANLFCELTLSRAGPVTGHAALDCEIGLTEGGVAYVLSTNRRSNCADAGVLVLLTSLCCCRVSRFIDILKRFPWLRTLALHKQHI